jgi:hypothetical protein
MRKLLFVVFGTLLFQTAYTQIPTVHSQNCSCELEFRHIRDFMEANYAGFRDKEARMTESGYNKLVKEYLGYSKGPHSTEHCLLIIRSFLDQFKDEARGGGGGAATMILTPNCKNNPHTKLLFI